MKNINDTRICSECKGICHGKTLRTKIGSRRRYFDSLQCAINYFKREFDVRLEDKELEDYILAYCCEYVNVVSQ